MDETPKPRWHVSSRARDRARSLRRDSTDAERIIWSAVRAHRMGGASFRRQTPIGPYIADFLCHEARLVIELDGGKGVLETIAAAIRGEGPLPDPPPQAGEGTSTPLPPDSEPQAS